MTGTNGTIQDLYANVDFKKDREYKFVSGFTGVMWSFTVEWMVPSAGLSDGLEFGASFLGAITGVGQFDFGPNEPNNDFTTYAKIVVWNQCNGKKDRVY